MKNNKAFKYSYLIFFIGILFPTIKTQAQQIIIDNPVKAGELTLFPVMGDENSYYYLSDKLRLATDKNGKPQFSFLKYVENVRSAPGAEDIREGTGGGILHFVISLSVTPEQLTEAKNELLRINPDGIIKGPVIYSRGTMSIISSFANTNGDLTKQVVGFGNAPLIDGEKAAVSMELTKKGAKILWEEFKTPTPDVSFSFEMELSGFRAPKKAIIEADFDKIYSHHSFDAAAVGNYGNIMFGGEIELAFDDLRNSGAIKVINMGSDASMDKLIETAYNKLTTMMFNPVGTGNPAVEALMKTITGKKSALDRATELYKLGKKNSAPAKSNPKQKNKTRPDKKTTPQKKSDKKKTSYFDLKNGDDYLLASANNNFYVPGYIYQGLNQENGDEWKPKHIKEVFKDWVKTLSISDVKKNELYKMIDAGEYSNLKDRIRSLFKDDPELNTKTPQYYRQYIFSDDEKIKYSDIINGKKDPDKEFINIIRERVAAIIYAQNFLNEKQKEYILNIATPDTSTSLDKNLHLTYVAWINKDSIRYMPKKKEDIEMVKTIYNLRDTPDSNISAIEEAIRKAINDSTSNNNNQNKPSGQDSTKIIKPGQGTGNTGGAATGGATAANKPGSKNKKTQTGNKKKKVTEKKSKKKTDFKMAVMATYQFKKIRQRGNFKISLDKYTADKLTLRFDENIGNVDCADCFKEVNLDDPMYKQREIVAMLDGFNYDDFGKYINYVNLKMKKTHEDGSITVDEVRIDRDNFMKSANNFKLMYGWKGDNDRSKWFEYEIQTQWSFFGGGEISEDWRKVNTNIIDLAAPYRRTSIELESDPELLKENKVRLITVKLYYKIGDSEQVKQVALRSYKDQFSEKVDIMLPANNPVYDYEISWRLYGNETKSSGRQTTSEPILFVDEL